MQRVDTRVVVIGGGPAGSTVSRFLAESGIENILVEKNLLHEKPCGGGIASTVFKEFNIPSSYIKKVVRSVRVISPSGTNVDVTLNEEFLAIVHRREFDKGLREMAKTSGSEIIEGEFRRIAHRNRKPSLIIKSNDSEKEIKADYVVAADGVNSMVRKNVLNGFPPRLFSMYTILNSDKTDSCEFYLGSTKTPYIYTWIFPHSNGVSIGTVGKAIAGAGEIKDYLEGFLKKRGLNGIKKIRGYSIPTWHDSIYYKKGVFFVGDTYGQVLPLTYEGVYYAMKSAEFVAHAIIENKPTLYKKLWKSRLRKRFVLMKMLQNLFLKNDASIEKLVALHKDRTVQEASLRLWLKKDPGMRSLLTYFNIIKNFIK